MSLADRPAVFTSRRAATPGPLRTWAAAVDANATQLEAITAEAKRRHVSDKSCLRPSRDCQYTLLVLPARAAAVVGRLDSMGLTILGA
jgi:uncharacterized protein YqjF (DUF2071 family)